MAGCAQSVYSSFLSTGVYFGVYEKSLKIFSDSSGCVPISSFLGTLTASLPMSFMSVRKKRLQAVRNNLISSTLGSVNWPVIFLLNLLNKYPKTLVKYSIYEYVLSQYHYVSAVGFFAGFVASIITALIFEPFEAVRTFKSLGIEIDPKNLYKGLKYGMLSSIISNTLGHGLLEMFAPR